MSRARARILMRDIGNGPLPDSIRRVQAEARESVRAVLAETGFRGHRLYVLEVAGRHPRVKIGISEDPWARIARHVADMNRYQYALIRAHVTDQLPDRLTAERAETQAHKWMSKLFAAPSSAEEFMDGDYYFGTVCADTAVALLTEP